VIQWTSLTFRSIHQPN